MSANVAANKNTQTGRATHTAPPLWQNFLLWGIILALLAAAIGMRLYQLGLPFDRDGYDEGVYWQSLRAMSAGQSLYQQIFYSQPPFFLLSTYPAFMLFGRTLWSARLGVALVSLLGLAGAFLLGKSLSGRPGAIAAMLLVIVNPLYLAQSQTLEAEVSSAAFSLLAVGAAYLWYDNPEGTTGLYLAVLSGVTLSLGILCKLLGISSLVPVALLMLARLWQVWRKQPGTSFASMGSMLVLIIACVVTLLLVLLPFLGSLASMMQGVITFHTDAKSVFIGERSGNVSIMLNFLKTELPLNLLALYGVVVALLHRNWKVLPLIAWLLVSLYLLWSQVPLFSRHFLAVIPPLIGIAVMGIRHIPSFDGSVLRRIVIPVLAILFFLIVTGINMQQDSGYYRVASAHGADANTKQEAHVAADLQNIISSDQLVITDAQFIAGLAGRDTPSSLVDTSTVRIDTHYVTLQQLINAASQPQVHAVLFYTTRFSLPPVAAFHDWIAQHFHLKYTYGPGKEIWVK